MPRRLPFTLPILVALVALPALAAPAALRGERPRNVIFMIPDGCGPATVALARMTAGHPLALDALLTGGVMTRSSDARVTDSAAAATAYATGHKTYNGGIGEDERHEPLGTLVEGAQAKGLAVGVVATSRVTHATPAAFASHVDERTSELVIAEQMLDHRLDVLLGGGREYFLPRSAGGLREDGRDLVAEARTRGVDVVVDREGLARAGSGVPRAGLRVSARDPGRRAGTPAPLLGLFAVDHIDFALNGDSLAQPRLVEMTRAALTRLAQAPRGFFVMIEGSRIDHAAHIGDAPATVREVLEFDEALRAALDFARRDGRTLVVVAADHETGGLTLGRTVNGESTIDLRPEVVTRVRKSADRLTEMVREAADPESVLREFAGVDSLGDEERGWLALRTDPRAPLDRGIAEIVDRRAGIGWASETHTAADVGLYAYGPGRERFEGLHDNTELGRAIAALLGLDLDGVTRRLRERAAAPAGTR